MKFIECPICHASLDFGEKCDCEKKHEDNTKRFEYIHFEVKDLDEK